MTEKIKFDYEAVCEAEDVIPVYETDPKKVLATKVLDFFQSNILLDRKKKTLRIRLKCAYGAINRDLNEEKFLRLDSKPNIDETFHIIRYKMNEIEEADNKFVAYN